MRAPQGYMGTGKGFWSPSHGLFTGNLDKLPFVPCPAAYNANKSKLNPMASAPGGWQLLCPAAARLGARGSWRGKDYKFTEEGFRNIFQGKIGFM